MLGLATMAPDFSERFCRRTGVTPARWHAVALRRALYPHARLLRPLLAALDPEFFAADRDFISGVGRLTRHSDFVIEAEEFAHHPANQSFLRRRLRLRVSVRRLHLLFIRAFAAEENESKVTEGVRAVRSRRYNSR